MLKGRCSYWYLFVLFLLFSQNVKAQDKPDIPTLKELSVTNEQGYVKIGWELTDSASVIIYRDSVEINAHINLDTIRDTSQHFFIDRSAGAHERSRSYRLAAYNTKFGNDYALGNKTPEFHTLFALAEYDTCDNRANLTATQYINDFMGTGDVAITHYFVASTEADGSRTILAESESPEFTLTELNNNSAYTFQVGGIPDKTSVDTTWSNPLSLFTNRKAPPEYIYPVLCSVTGSQVDLGFEIDTNSQLDTYWLLKQAGDNTSYDTIAKESGISAYYNYNDILTNQLATYKLLAINSCLQPSTVSKPVQTMQLRAQQISEWTFSLQWNRALESSQQYTLWRKVGDGAFQERTTGKDITEFNEDLTNLPEAQRTQQICYQVATTLQPSGTASSFSNQVCLDISPEVKIPNAFTPNNDGRNDSFTPLFSFVATRYQLTIANRYGEVLFESNVPGERWDGTDARGNALPEGTYIYFLEITSNTGQIIEKSGNITLLYP